MGIIIFIIIIFSTIIIIFQTMIIITKIPKELIHGLSKSRPNPPGYRDNCYDEEEDEG